MKYDISKLLERFCLSDDKERVCLKHDDGSKEHKILIDIIHNLVDDLDMNSAYSWVEEAIEFINENKNLSLDDISEIGHDFADGVEIYTMQLTEWLNCSLVNVQWLDNDFKTNETTGSDLLMLAQYSARDHVFNRVIEGINYLEHNA